MEHKVFSIYSTPSSRSLDEFTKALNEGWEIISAIALNNHIVYVLKRSVDSPVRKSEKEDDLEDALALQLAIYFNMREMHSAHVTAEHIKAQADRVYELRSELENLKK